jgi:hypothetical protein
VSPMTCPFCDGSHAVGTERCPVTGALLDSSRALSAPEMEGDITRGSEPSLEEAGVDPERRLAMHMLPDGPTIRLEPGSSLRLGREESPIAAACSDNVSRRHAEIRFVGDQVVVVDIGAFNGTFVNERQLVPFEPEPIGPGDIIRLANDPPVLLRLVDPE